MSDQEQESNFTSVAMLTAAVTSFIWFRIGGEHWGEVFSNTFYFTMFFMLVAMFTERYIKLR